MLYDNLYHQVSRLIFLHVPDSIVSDLIWATCCCSTVLYQPPGTNQIEKPQHRYKYCIIIIFQIIYYSYNNEQLGKSHGRFGHILRSSH